MPQSFDPVFGDWYTQKCIGNGTDGRVYTITRKDENGKTHHSILKTIRLSDNRNENKGFNSINDDKEQQSAESLDEMMENITSNIETIRKADGGKRFVKYEEWETRPTSDNKGKIILIRLEEMRSLTDLLERFSFTLEETIRLGISVCKALSRCRDFGYVYPNLKPENILFDRNGICKLGDFGSFSSLEPAKSSVAFKRTQYYMAPEFIKSGKINCTCDTYSLGLVLYMLTNRGRLPFTEMWPQEVTVNGLDRSKENRMNALPLPKPATASDALFEIISKACAFKEEDRYLSPKQMLADLQNVLLNKPLQKTEYDDIYSVSSKESESKEQEINEEVEVSEPYEENVQEKKSIYSQPVKLHEEISIPDVTPMDYASGNKPVKRKRPVSYASLPKVKGTKKKNNANIRTIAAIIIAIVVVLILLAVSITLRMTADDEQLVESTLAPVLISFSGVIFNGC